MDNGEVLVDIDKGWEFAGCNAIEWICGLAAFILIGLLGSNPAKVMPFMLMGWILTTTGFSAMRRTFPDEHRGVRNAIMTYIGVCPFGIPAPSKVQPLWSACPLRSLDANSKFIKLGLDQLFPSFERDQTDAPTE